MANSSTTRRRPPSVAIQRAAQIEALKRWNDDPPTRPRWDEDGNLAQRLYPGPLDVRLLHYLSAAGRGAVEKASADQQYRRGKERRAVELLQGMAKYAGEAAELVRSVAGIYSEIGPAVAELREVTASLPQIAKWKGAKLFRPELRGDLAIGVRGLLELRGCDSPPSVLALASILCGEFPNLPDPDDEEHTADLVIEEERKLIDAILNARKKTSTKVAQT
jgi:hypothetical protein